jgi:hypothetical protein
MWSSERTLVMLCVYVCVLGHQVLYGIGRLHPLLGYRDVVVIDCGLGGERDREQALLYNISMTLIAVISELAYLSALRHSE